METNKKIIALEIHQNNIMKELKEIKDVMKEFKVDFKEFINTADKKYSAKWVEKALLFWFWIVWSTIIWSLMILILK